MPEPLKIAPPTGRLGILTPGMGAVATTLYAGVLAARQGISKPYGSLTQMAHIRLGERDEGRNPMLKDFAPIAGLDDIVFGGWDPISSNALEAARTAGVVSETDLAPISAELEGVAAMTAVFEQRWVRN
ncbi:MAG TPA: inositol-3-phosphate synthase, partial [Microthrixaceae bacterium]|nr:inositol-3-phosphate synthase [Microthrixaceae bacterium]